MRTSPSRAATASTVSPFLFMSGWSWGNFIFVGQCLSSSSQRIRATLFEPAAQCTAYGSSGQKEKGRCRLALLEAWREITNSRSPALSAATRRASVPVGRESWVDTSSPASTYTEDRVPPSPPSPSDLFCESSPCESSPSPLLSSSSSSSSSTAVYTMSPSRSSSKELVGDKFSKERPMWLVLGEITLVAAGTKLISGDITLFSRGIRGALLFSEEVISFHRLSLSAKCSFFFCRSCSSAKIILVL
mmetsp:Transcript_6556/g.14206  ORF Transcript_6556/g.14206 Transcript_6556/m.14206 type:complete len:246 (+) Transcript_6556:55-792(+)